MKSLAVVVVVASIATNSQLLTIPVLYDLLYGTSTRYQQGNPYESQAQANVPAR